MTTFHDLRRDAEAMLHTPTIYDALGAIVVNACPIRAGEKTCTCGRNKLLSTLDAAKAHLREMVFEVAFECHTRGRIWGKDGVTKEHMQDLERYVNRQLAAFLNPPDESDE